MRGVFQELKGQSAALRGFFFFLLLLLLSFLVLL